MLLAIKTLSLKMKKQIPAIFISLLLLACGESKTKTESPAPKVNSQNTAEIDSLKLRIDQHLVLLDSLSAVQSNLTVSDSALEVRISKEKELLDQLMSELDRKEAALPPFQP